MSQTPLVEHLGESDIMVSYRQDYDDLTIQEGAFSFTLDREEFEALKNFLNKLTAEKAL